MSNSGKKTNLLLALEKTNFTSVYQDVDKTSCEKLTSLKIWASVSLFLDISLETHLFIRFTNLESVCGGGPLAF